MNSIQFILNFSAGVLCSIYGIVELKLEHLTIKNII